MHAFPKNTDYKFRICEKQMWRPERPTVRHATNIKDMKMYLFMKNM